MTDVSPCVSLTVRLLSLQSKTSVHIEEIYVFADPDESTNDDSVTGPDNMGGSSLLTMLVPGLMQMSNSSSYKIDDGYFSHGSRSQPAPCHAVKDSSPYVKITQEAQEAGTCVTDDSKYKPAGIEMGIDSTDGGTAPSEKSNQDQLQYKDPMSVQLPAQTTENMQVPPVNHQLVSDTNHLAYPLMNGTFNPYNHIERKLDTLLSKVDKMELYCSRFEDNMIKPLGSIEARLQRLEQQFDSFSVEIQSLRDSSRMSVQDDPSGTNSQEKTQNDSNARTSDRKPSLFVRAPDFSSEDSCNYNETDGNQVSFCRPNTLPQLLVKVPEFISQPDLTREKLHEVAISPVDCTRSSQQKERKTSPGLQMKIPEFPDDDDDEEVEDEKKTEVSDHDDHTQEDTLCRNTIDSSKSKNRVSVNGALASALEALLMSTKGTSSSNSVLDPANGEIDGASHTSLLKPVLEGKLDTNKKNNHLDSDKLAFVASTASSLDVPSQRHIAVESIDDGSCANEQNNGVKLKAMPFVTCTGPSDPSHPPATCESVENGAQVDENRPAIPLSEFFEARNSHSCKNDASEVCCTTNAVAEMLSFDSTLAEGGKHSTNVSQLLVMKALEVDGEDESAFSVPVLATFEGSSCSAPCNVVKEHNFNRIETVSDKDFSLENTENSARFSFGLNSIYSQCSATGSLKNLTEDSSFDWNLEGNFSKPKVEDCWSDLSTMESFNGVHASQPVFSESTIAGKSVEDLAGTAVSSTSTVTPVAGEELHKVCDVLYEYKDDMLGVTSTENRTSKSSPSLEVLLAESSSSEAQTSDLEDIHNDAGIGSAQLFGSSSSSDDNASAPTEPLVDVADLPSESEVCAAAFNEPLVDVGDLPSESEAYAVSYNEPEDDNASAPTEPLVDVADLPSESDVCAAAFNEPLVDDPPSESEAYAVSYNEPLSDVVDLPTSSETASGVNEPLVDVVDVDQPTSSEAASGASEPLANVDLPKPLETFAGGSTEEHPNSLI